ncbi:hypothetical protein [Arboricoccus pini]|nr:hypothetical protein [Arboricoccus pini]
MWNAFDKASAMLDEEAGGVVAVLDRLDDALAKHSLFDRISQLLEEWYAKSADRYQEPTSSV